MSGYALSKCLKEQRLKREASGEDTEEERGHKYEQPGELFTLPSGIQYREIEAGSGPAALLGSVCEIRYVIYRLASGAYFKYSSGGTPVFLYGLGYGTELKQDLDEVYKFTLGAPNSLPAAVTLAMVGMRQGGRRRVLMPPSLGFVNDQVGPKPPDFGAQRRLESRRSDPLLFEVELVRVTNGASDSDTATVTTSNGAAIGSDTAQNQGQSAVGAAGGGGGEGVRPAYRLPAPPSPYKRLLGQPGQ